MGWPDLAVIWAALAVFILSRSRPLFLKSLRQSAVLAVFTLPVLIVRFFTLREGRRYRILMFDLYSGALDGTLTAFLRILCIALVSALAFFLVFPRRTARAAAMKNPVLEIFYTSIELYQGMLTDLVGSFRKHGRKGFLARLDRIYREEKKESLRRQGSSVSTRCS